MQSASLSLKQHR